MGGGGGGVTVEPPPSLRTRLSITRITGLTLAVLAVLVPSGGHSRVHVVAAAAVRVGAVGLGGREAVHRLDGRLGRTLTAAGDGVGRRGLQGAVQWRDGEVGLRLRGHAAGVGEDAHHLDTQQERVTAGNSCCATHQTRIIIRI